MSASAGAVEPKRRAGKFFAAAILLAAIVVVGFRAAALARGEIRTARSETKFFEWAFGPDGQKTLDALAAQPSLPEGATVCLDALPHRRVWTRAVGSYVLPRQDVVVSTVFRRLGSPPCRRPEIAPGVRAARFDASKGEPATVPWRAVVRDLLGIALAAAAGWRWIARSAFSVEDFFLAAWVGLALSVPLVLVAGLAGLPVTGIGILAIEVAIAAGATFRGGRAEA